MEQQARLPMWFLVANWALIVAAFVLGTLLAGRRSDEFELPEPQRSALEIVYHEVLQSHIEPPDEHELLERAIQGMVDGLDRYSRYIPPREVPRYQENSTGQYQGIGASIQRHDDALVVHFPFPGGPADTAGLLPGDVLIAIDGNSLADQENSSFIEMLRGPADTTVQIGIDRDGDNLNISVNRGDVQRPCVKWVHFADEDASLGYVYLSSFHPTAADQLRTAIDSLAAEQALRGLILDLRFDGGGNLDACLDIARTFLQSGVIATQMRRTQTAIETYTSDGTLCRYPDLPLVLLVNGESASASEVLAGALQDHHRAAVVGQRTFGKGYVNTDYTWSNHKFKLKLTTGSYRTPSGRNIERNQTTNTTQADKDNGGILPDVEITMTKEERQLALSCLRYSIEPPAKHRDAFAQVAARYGIDVPSPPRSDSDPQFAAALETLRSRSDAANRNDGR